MASKKFKIVDTPIPLPLYKKIHRSIPLICTDVVIVGGTKKKYFLMVKRKFAPERGEWWFSGGRILKNELLKEAVTRKVTQETGLKPKNITQLGIYEYFSPVGYFKGMNSHMLAIVYSARVNIRDTVILDYQSTASKWYSKIDPHWHPYIKKYLRKAGFSEHGK